jgi:SAM-dependent methyltransferase
MLAYAATIFLSAFLLFQVQPLIARMILPWFGGSAAVWTTCMLFFQLVLLTGYLYSHWAVRNLAPRMHAALHGALLAASLLVLPITPGASWKPAPGANPSAAILLLLAVSVGLPYFLLSATSPLLQSWYARTAKGVLPYRLFALSNLGSLLALVTYPFVVEPLLAARTQGLVWSCAYAAFTALCGFTAWRSTRGGLTLEPAHLDESEAVPPPAPSRLAVWITLAALPSALLLSVTNHLTQDVAAVPFLWIVPLTLYLLSFIFCFDAQGWYQRNAYLVLLPVSLLWMAYALDKGTEDMNVRLLLGAFSAAFFVTCMVCHGELVRLKPHPEYLTSFYLMLSLGGALGGVFVGLAAPYLFPANFEFPIAIVLCGLMLVWLLVQEPDSKYYEAWTSLPVMATMAATLALCFYLGRTVRENIRDNKLIERNFYGILRVRENGTTADWDGYRSLLHGSINHGEEWIHPKRRRDPLTYYCADSGVGRAIRTRKPDQPQKVGVFGLGAGSIAGYGRPGDVYRFYEINPLVVRLARSEFFYLPEARQKVDIALGDARLSLESEPPQNFDVLAIDCFSGDSIPVHLLTLEAVQLYFRHLKPGGILAVHVSNRFLELEPVLARIGANLAKPVLVVETEEEEGDESNCFGTTWVLLANGKDVLEQDPVRGSGKLMEAKAGMPLWTDDYSSLFRILK